MTSSTPPHYLLVVTGNGSQERNLQVSSFAATGVYISWLIWQIQLNFKTEKLDYPTDFRIWLNSKQTVMTPAMPNPMTSNTLLEYCRGPSYTVGSAVVEATIAE